MRAHGAVIGSRSGGTVGTHTRLRRFRRDSAAGTLVEFAIVFPILVVLTFGVIELGFAFYAQNTLTAAAREGARYAVVRSSLSNRIATVDSVRNFVLSRIPFRNMGGITVATSWPSGNTPGSPVQVNVQYAFRPITGLGILGQRTLSSTSSMVITY